MKYDIERPGWWSKKSPNPHGKMLELLASWTTSNLLCILRWEMSLEFYFDMTCGAQNDCFSRIPLGWHVSKMQPYNTWCLEMGTKSLEYNFL